MTGLVPPPPPPMPPAAQEPVQPDVPTVPPPPATAGAPSVPRAASRGTTVRLRTGRGLAIAALAAPLVTQRIMNGGALWITIPAVLLAAAVLVLPVRPTRRWPALGVLVVLVFGLLRVVDGAWYLGIVIAVVSAAVWLLVRERQAVVFAVVLPVAALVEAGQTWGWNAFYNAMYARFSVELVQTLLSAWTLSFVLVEIAMFVAAARLDRRLAPAAAARAEQRNAARAAAQQAGLASAAAAPTGTAPTGTAPPGTAYAPAAAVPGRTNTLALLALVFGLLGSGVVPVVLGHVALAQIRRTGESGRGMAIAGLVLGYVALGAGLLLLIVYAVTIASISGSM